VVALQAVTILLVALAAASVALARDLVRQALLFSLYGFGLVVLFAVYQAPDVALSALVVSGIAYLSLYVARLPHRATDGLAAALAPLRTLHSGHVGDYAAWLAFGVAVIGGLFAVAIR
jgi:multisubunit Na+/H+ antiporter MnhB subunit